MSPKGIVLAGGAGTRLFPATKIVNKQLLPIYDKPMIYYPLSSLMLGGIRDILLITSPEQISFFQKLLGDGSQWGIQLSYAIQPKPEGIAQVFLIGADFIQNEPVTLILGDNIFWGHDFPKLIQSAIHQIDKATVFLYYVNEPERYGVAQINQNFQVVDVEEKPRQPKSNWAITGLYCYDKNVVEYAKQLKPSARGELEITDLNRIYLQKGMLRAEIMGRGFAWLDTGTHKSMLQASMFVETLEERQGLLIGSLEEIAYRLGYISVQQLEEQAKAIASTDYGKCLLRLVHTK